MNTDADELLESTLPVPYIKSPPQIFTSTLYSKKSLSAESAAPVYDPFLSPVLHVSNIKSYSPPPQLPTISTDALRSVWESDSSLADGPILPVPPKASSVRSQSTVTVERIEAYLEGSKVRDSLDYQGRVGTGKHVVDNRF